MDKYEFNIKVEKMKKAVDRKDYATAARVADSLGWERSTNAKVLMMIAQIYEKQERYTDARNALTAVYNRVPVGKRIVYKLAELAVKCGDVQEALDLYKEYQEMAPNDPTKLILAYKISTARGDDLEKRISILEAYRRRDFDEKWAYELATLYQQAGRGSDCVALCDEIILWFGVGPYVDKAMTLKVAYEPLTPEQEEKRANKDYYEQRLAEVAAASMQIVRPESDSPEDDSVDTDEADDSEDVDEVSADHSENIPGVSPVVKEADLHLTMQQELAQAIQSTSDDLTPETTVNEWITDKPLSVDRVGEDIDGQYTLFQTASEEIGEPHVPEHTRTFSFGALLSKTRRLDSLRDLAELNSAQMAEETDDEEAVAEETPVEETVGEETIIEKAVVETAEMDYDELAEAFEAAVAEEAEAIKEAVAEETPVEEAVVDEIAAEETAVEEAAAEEAAVEEAAAEEAAVEEAAAEEAAVEEAAAEEAVPEETVVEEAVVEEIASKETVTEEAVAEETVAEETVAETVAPEVVTKPQRMIFCHVLKLNDESSAVAQIKDSIRQAHEVSGIPAASIARIGVDKINRAGFSAVLTKLQGRDLLLEHAGELTQRAIDQLIAAVEEPPCTTVILLADDAAGVSELYRKAPALFPLSAMEDIEEEMIEESPVEEDEISFDLDSFLKSEAQIVAEETADESDIPGSTFEEPVQTEDVPYSNRAQALSPNEFIRFIVEYALENDCKFDSMAELALAAHIDRMELNRVPLNRDTAMELADRIIDRADHWTLKCLFVSRYDKEGYLIIKESHIH